MKQLWSPWRMSYIQDLVKKGGCVFCQVNETPKGLENLVIHRGIHSYVILNRFPYTSGHLMVVPFKHESDLDALPQDTRSEMMELVTRCIEILRDKYHAQGFNVGANMGSAAGAGIPKHFHFHIVPRWGGDTNFMSAIGETRVVPEDLGITYQRVCEAWEQFLQNKE
jgi:ATP adenylyltransferase